MRKGKGRRILVIGSGPIVIGQACEFDYSGTQACRALRDEGAEVVLMNSNPATIMTDPSTADRTYIEPLTLESLADILAVERPDSILPTVGGQTALNLAMAASRSGLLAEHGVTLIGASIDAIDLAEDRERFAEAMRKIGLDMPRSVIVRNEAEIEAALADVGVPAIVRPSFTMGGTGGGMAMDPDGFRAAVRKGLDASPVRQVLVEESIAGWKEYELEVMRDRNDNVVIVCSIENLDPMGVHTGDSITVAPAQTLTDVEYQKMRNAALSIIRAVGVETGGSNIQFAVNPRDGRLTVIEMNPRVSRSSALASKATGFPIAKIAAKLALGYTLDQLRNDITRTTSCCFEPVIDYVVVKIPRFDFGRFPEASPSLGPQMKSVGEIMAIGRTFREAFRKGIASLEEKPPALATPWSDGDLSTPTPTRVYAVYAAIRAGRPIDEVFALTGIDPWFLRQFRLMADKEQELRAFAGGRPPRDRLLSAKRDGASDSSLGDWLGTDAATVRGWREQDAILPSYLRVDTCAGEFESFTPYLYSTYETRCEAEPTDRRKVMILGSGPNRIGQGIEFDYSCCHAVFALRDRGYETIMVNCNPETVSTDYDTADRLYFEPLDVEHVLEVWRREKPIGAIVQLGGQTPLRLARALEDAGVRILGTSVDAIDLAEDRGRFGRLMDEMGVRCPAWGVARSAGEALKVAERIGYPVLVRPSYVLGGQKMRIIYTPEMLQQWLDVIASAVGEYDVLIDAFLEDAFEYDVDALCDGERVVIAGILEHVEEAGVHSGDSSAILPPQKVKPGILEQMRDLTRAIGTRLGVRGLMNVQYAEKDGLLYVLEVNPRASRTVPFLAKAMNLPLVQMATRLMVGESLADVGLTDDPQASLVFAKAPVFPFSKFPGVDVVLGPEMRSTGEVMGIGRTAGEAYHKAMEAAGVRLPAGGTIFLSVNDRDKDALVPVAKRLLALGFDLVATRGTALHLFDAGVPTQMVFKVAEGSPNAGDWIRDGRIGLVIDTPLGQSSRKDERALRVAAAARGIPVITTLTAAEAAAEAMEIRSNHRFGRFALQDL